jgi:predicted nucleic acid-binding Zn ribbon protein
MTDCIVCGVQISSERENNGHTTCSIECHRELIKSAQSALKTRLEAEAQKIDSAYWRDE